MQEARIFQPEINLAVNENIREITLDTLITLDTEHKKSHLYIRDVLLNYDYLDYRDKAFFKRLTEGTISYRLTLDYILNSVSSKPMDKCKVTVRNLLRMSAYQLLYMERVPDNAVVDEACKLCKKKHYEQFVPFVNAILRKVSKDKENLLNFEGIEDECLRLSVKYSCPEWIVKMFKKEQGDAEAILKGLLRVRPTTVRLVYPEKKDEILKAWEKDNVKFKPAKYVDDAFYLEGFEGIESVYGFKEGFFFAQDESSMMAAMATGVTEKDNLTVMDVCAAPGGKSMFAASLMKGKGEVLSFDVSDSKVQLIWENVSRCHLTNVSPMVADASEYHEEFKEKADILICDVPCSGLGVMARKSDIKYNITNEAMKDICDLQKKILLNAANYLKPGGVLIYSTCTIHKAENEKMVKFILNNLPFRGDSLKPFLPAAFEKERESESYLQLIPAEEGTDGFFIARFVKDR